MLYLLYESLKDGDFGKYFNFLRYPTFRLVAAGVSSLLIGMLVGPKLIDRLRLSQHGQSNVPEDTPETHQKKKGTPTLGGSLILLGIFFGTLLFADLHSRVVWVALLMTGGWLTSFPTTGLLSRKTQPWRAPRWYCRRLLPDRDC
jgi:phospho-N-acetylmuramoyl-pentapeptide-transferase